MEIKAKESKEQTEKEKVERNEMSALYFYQKWEKDGKHVCDNGYPELGKKSSTSITKVLLARIDASGATYGKRDDYLTMKKCEQLIVELKGGTTWDTEMESLEKEFGGTLLQNRTLLFKLPPPHPTPPVKG